LASGIHRSKGQETANKTTAAKVYILASSFWCAATLRLTALPVMLDTVAPGAAADTVFMRAAAEGAAVLLTTD